MRNIYKLFALLFTFSLFWGCENTKLGDKDLDFDVTIDNKELISYIGKPVRIGISVDILDSQNNYPFETKIKSATGLLKSGTEAINSEEVLDYDYRRKGTLYFEYTPVQKGKETLVITIKNELVTRTVSCNIECKEALYNVEIQDAPDKPLIDTKFDFSLIIHEMEATGADSIVAYARVLKGEGLVYSGEDIINLSSGEDNTKNTKAGVKAVPLAIGKNMVSYQSSREGENTIRFYLTNKWGIETYQDVTASINLPAWGLSNSMGRDYVNIPYQDNYSFNLSVDEGDIFKDNQYTAFFRILSNTDLELSINDKKYSQGASFGLNAGGNVGILKVNDATQEGMIEFIVKDKYKQEHKDTIRFASKLPVKPIVAALDKSSQSVKVLQEAVFKLTLSEQNYNSLFNVSLEQLSGSGTFDNGNSLLFSEGTHTIKYTPKTQGAHTFKITIKDGNNQEKVLNATVQATISPLNASLSATSLNIAQGGTGTLTLSTTEADYTDNFTISYTASGAANKFEFGQNVLGVGGKVNYKAGDNLITITGLALGTSAYNLIIEDIYNQKKELSFNAIVKGQVTVTASTGGTVSGDGSFNLNQSCTVKATPNTGNQFAGWYNGSTKVSDDAIYTFPVTESISLEAKFSTKVYIISATAETGGSITGSGTYNHGAAATLKATVNTGYTFDGWYEGATKVSTAAEYQITVTAAKTFVARFTANSYNITVNAQTGGTVSGGGTKKYNETATVTATPGTGYTFAGWYNGNNKVSDAATYNFTVTGAVTLEARFTANKYAITVNALDGGTVSGGGNFDFGSNISVTATPSANYDFLGWYEDDKQASTSATYNFTVSKARTLEARFKLKEYILTVSASTGGTATGSGTYEYNSTVTITATAATGYTFDGWYEGSNKLSGNASYVIKVTGARSIEAKFTANKYNVVVNAQTGGTASGSGSFSYNTNVTVTATASTNYTFDGWYEGSTKVSSSLSYTFKITKETTLEAKFTANKFTVTATATTGGTVSGSGSYDYNTNATVTATAGSTYQFTGWYENNSQVSTSNPYIFKVEKAHILEARFEQIKYTVTATASTGGTVSGSGTYVIDTDVSVTATPSTGYAFDGWYNGTSKVSSNAGYTFKATANVALEAKFTINQYTISATAETGGSITGSGTYNHGAAATLKATVNTGYTFDGWYEGATKVSTAAEYQITVTAAKTFVARFTANSYNITVNAQTGGTVSGGGTKKYNETATVTATPGTGYTFAGWYNGNNKVSDAATYNFTVTGAVTLEARFTANKYNIVVNAQTGGTASGSGSFDYNTNTTVTATPNTGYSFDGWYNGSTKVSEVLSYTFTVTGAITLEARFTIKSFNIIVNAQTGGSATGGGTYNYGTNVTLKATVNNGYTFAGWYLNNSKVSEALNYTFTVNQAATYEARFTINQYNLVVNAGTGGTVSGSGTYDYNSTVTVRATANSHYSFDGWYEGATKVSSSANYTFTLLKETTLSAKFVIDKHTVTLSGTNGTQTGGGSFDYNTNATITATPGTNYQFTGWYENNNQISTSNPYTFAVTANRIIEARYQLIKRTVTLTAGTGGTAAGGGSFNHGTSVTLTATPNTGYSFDGWYNGSTKVSSSTSYTFTVTADIPLTAKFVINKYLLTLSAETGGTVSGGGTYDHGTSVTAVATANTGYTFDGWYNGATKVSSNASYTFTLTSAMTLTAKFKLNTYTVSVSASTGGTATGGGTFNHGTSVTLTATPNTGYSFDGWYNGATKVSSSASYTFTLTSAVTLTAKFTLNSYTVSVSASTGGTATGGGTFNYGTSATVNASVSTGYVFDGWYDGATKVSSNASYTFTVTATVTLTAKFSFSQETQTYVFTSGGSIKTITYNKYYKVNQPIVFRHVETGTINGYHILMGYNKQVDFEDYIPYTQISQTVYEYTVPASKNTQTGIITIWGATEMFSFTVIAQ